MKIFRCYYGVSGITFESKNDPTIDDFEHGCDGEFMNEVHVYVPFDWRVPMWEGWNTNNILNRDSPLIKIYNDKYKYKELIYFGDDENMAIRLRKMFLHIIQDEKI